MQFAVSLVRLLCGLMAGVLLVAYLYFSINFEQSDLAISHTLSVACLWLFVVALLIWGGLAVIGDIWLKRLDTKEFYQRLMSQNQYSNLTENPVADNSQQFNDLLIRLNEANTDSQKTLLSGIDDLNNKISALGDGTLQTGTITDDLREDVRLIGKNMQELQTQIDTLLSQLQNQKKILSQLSDYPARLENGKTDYYPILQEEAEYPESVIDYKESDSDIMSSLKENASKNEDIPAEITTASDQEFIDSIIDEAVNINNEQNQDIPLEDFIDTPLDGLSADTSNEILPDGTDDTTSEPLDFESDTAAQINDSASFAEDADNLSDTQSIDIKAIEPAIGNRKDEPNLEHIFNDELASELADLEILNGKPTAKTQDDIDLEQFFAGYKKALDK